MCGGEAVCVTWNCLDKNATDDNRKLRKGSIAFFCLRAHRIIGLHIKA